MSYTFQEKQVHPLQDDQLLMCWRSIPPGRLDAIGEHQCAIWPSKTACDLNCPCVAQVNIAKGEVGPGCKARGFWGSRCAKPEKSLLPPRIFPSFTLSKIHRLCWRPPNADSNRRSVHGRSYQFNSRNAMRSLLLWTVMVSAVSLVGSATYAMTPVKVSPMSVEEVIPQSARSLTARVLETADHRELPFAIVDKRAAMVMVFRADGTLAGLSPALLGRDTGDDSVPGVGERAQKSRLRIGDRTTPAGRFESQPGRNLAREPIVWVDYSNALSIHRLRPGPSRQGREIDLASMNLRDKRRSDGCVVVPEEFYTTVIEPVLGRSRGIIYIMPESSSWQDKWPKLGKPAPQPTFSNTDEFTAQ